VSNAIRNNNANGTNGIGKHASTGGQGPADGIDDFLKVIEERFKETETVLAQSV